MSGHKDATGYLLELRNEISYDWFSFACDLALSATDDTISSIDSDALTALFLEKQKYKPKTADTATATTTTTTAPSVVRCPLRELTGFTNFKRLAGTLHITFDKRITLVFGANGSGKSSICEAIKMLASPNAPNGPLNNVHGQLSSQPSFSYRFEPDVTSSAWDKSEGYGKFSSRIKYFDSTIAVSRVSDALHPETVVEVAPFRLEVFDYCRSFVRHLQEAVGEIIKDADKEIEAGVAVVSAAFTDISNEYKSAITELSSGNFSKLEQELTAFTPLTADDTREYDEAKQALARLEAARTEQGLKALQREANDLRRIHRMLGTFLDLCQKTSPKHYKRLVRELSQKKSAQQSLATELFPVGVAVDKFTTFLVSSQEVFVFPGQDGDSCPFCRRPLDGPSLELIHKYHSFLIDTLREELRALEGQIDAIGKDLAAVRDFELDIDDEAASILPPKQWQDIVKLINDTKTSIPDPLPRDEEPLFGTFDAHHSLETARRLVGEEANKRDSAIQKARAGAADSQEEISRLTEIIRKYYYRKRFSEKLSDLKMILSKCKSLRALDELVNITDFRTILRRMTNAGKDAHTALVVAEFEKSLEREYLALSQRSFVDFGIRLKPRGEQQAIAIDPRIGDAHINRVLSEGEQKIHALAMFFCEAMAQPCDIFVFDDPSTSFDYNHLSSFVKRLRDLVHQLPGSQVIILTHNWDLFMQIQIVFNKANLNNHMEVKVMEHCATVESYSEKLDDLQDQIAAMLALPGNFDSRQTVKISGLMRRLIECVVNTYVFNNRRHQFKQKSYSVSEFSQYTRLVPLKDSEAQKLSDLYTDLSVSEHDDLRNAYVTRDKASFQHWYNEIVAVADDLRRRRPT